jgi:hypothetical protein
MEVVVSPETVVQALNQAGFKRVERRVSIGLFSEYEATREPERRPDGVAA